jgi:hypothetical protein
MKTKLVKTNKGKILASVTGVQAPNPTRENVDIKDSRSKWLLFFKGSNNVYINDLAKRKRRSPTHSAVLKSKLVFTAGLGIIYRQNGEVIKLNDKQKKYVDNINANGETLYEVYKKVQGDFIDFGNAYPQVVKEGQRSNIFHSDATTVRISKNKETAYISNFWRDIGNEDVFPRKDFEIKDIDLTGKESNYLVHIMNYEPEYNIYGVIDHTAALKDADIEYKISTFNLDKLDNGFFPSVMIQMYGDPPDGKTPEEYAESIATNFTGEGKSRKFLLQLLEQGVDGAEIHEFEGAAEGEFRELKQLAKESIIEAHRWHPALMMLTPGKLANSSDIRTAYEMVKNTVIPDYRIPVLKVFENILNDTELFTDIELSIKPVVPVSAADEIDVGKIWTVDEQREETGKLPFDDKAIGESLLKGGNVNISTDGV